MKKIPTVWLFVVCILVLAGFSLNSFLLDGVNTSSLESDQSVSVSEEDVSSQNEITDAAELITVTQPKQGAVVSNPIEVSGEARGYWFFEASFPIEVVDIDGVTIGEGYATAQGDWMTEEFVPFTGTIEYMLPEDTVYQPGKIVFKKDNPSALPENDASIEVAVFFKE